METFEETQEVKEEKPEPKVINTYARNCDECGKEYFAKLGTSKFCSDACKNKHHRKVKKTRIVGMSGPEDDIDKPKSNERTNVVSVISGLPPQAQYIIGAQEKENRRLQKMYDEEREARKKLKSKYEDLKQEFTQLQTDHKIESIENKKPSGLAGFMESPIGPQLMEHLGPALGMLAQGLVQKISGVAGGLAGIEGQLDADVQNQITEINKWYAGLPKPLQASIYDILVKFASQKPEQLPNVLTRISNLLSHGSTTTIVSNGHNAATGTFQ